VDPPAHPRPRQVDQPDGSQGALDIPDDTGPFRSRLLSSLPPPHAVAAILKNCTGAYIKNL